MPRRQIHDQFERAFLGKVTGISEVMDAPSKELRGNHRQLYHDEDSVLALALELGRTAAEVEDYYLAGMLHLLVDSLFDSRPSTSN